MGKELPPLSTNFNIQANIEEVKQEFIKAGFSPAIKHWYQQGNWIYDDGDDFVNKFMGTNPEVAKCDAQLHQILKEIYEDQGSDLRTFEFMIILVQKL